MEIKGFQDVVTIHENIFLDKTRINDMFTKTTKMKPIETHLAEITDSKKIIINNFMADCENIIWDIVSRLSPKLRHQLDLFDKRHHFDEIKRHLVRTLDTKSHPQMYPNYVEILFWTDGKIQVRFHRGSIVNEFEIKDDTASNEQIAFIENFLGENM